MIKDPKQLVSAINQICAERNLPRERVIEAIESALKTAYKKDYGTREHNIKAVLNETSGEFDIFLVKTVVDTVEIPEREILLKDAKKIKKTIKLDDELEFKIDIENKEFGRIAAQAAKQVINQKLQEIEREILFETFKERENELISALITKVDGKSVFLEIEKSLVPLHPDEQVKNERYFPGTRIKVYLHRVIETPQGPKLIISRKSPELTRKLFEAEIPEIRNGIVEIKKIAREAGVRSKIAIISKDTNVDPIGACVGQKGVRIQNVIRELNGEMIDVIEWKENIIEFIKATLAPAKVNLIILDKEKDTATVYVDPEQRPLAIGKHGQNVRLASILVGMILDIRDISEAPKNIEEEEIKKQAEDIKDIKIPAKKDYVKLLDLPNNIKDKLIKSGLEKISILKQVPIEELNKIKGIGKETSNTIIQSIQKYIKEDI